MSALTYETDATAMIFGVGLMGQFLATNAPSWLRLSKLVLVDHADEINVAGTMTPLVEFAEVVASSTGNTEVVAETLDVSSDEDVAGLF